VFEVRLEEDRSYAMNIIIAFATDSTAFNAILSGSTGDKQNGKHPPICEHSKKPWHTKEQCWKLRGSPLNGRRRPPNDKPNPGRALVGETNSGSHNLR